MKRFAFGTIGLIAFLAVALFSTSPVFAGGPTLTSVTTRSSSVVGGNTLRGEVKISAKAPEGGLIVSLSSDDTSVAKVPATVKIAYGKGGNSFTITTNGVASNKTVTITATLAGVSQEVDFTVTPASLSGLKVDSSVVSGNTLSGIVSLNGKAPSTGFVVDLSSSSSLATVADSVTVAAGKTSVSFKISTKPVTEATQVTITAEAGAVTKSATLTLNRAELSKLSVTPSSVTGGSSTTVNATVTLTGPAPAGGLVVTLSKSGSAISVPASVTVPAGAKSAKAKVTHRVVAESTSTSVSATLFGRTKTDSLTVVPPTVSSVSISPSTVTSGFTSKGTAKLNAPAPTGGIRVTLSASSTVVDMPASIVIAEGKTSGTFEIVTDFVEVQTTVTIKANSKSAKLTVKAIQSNSLVAFVIVPSPTAQGVDTGGGVGIYDVAPSGGIKVTLQSSKSSVASVPASVTIPAGEQIAFFAIKVGAVTSPTTVTISASSGGVTLSLKLTVVPADDYVASSSADGGQSVLDAVAAKLEAALED